MREISWHELEAARLDHTYKDLDDHELCRRNSAAAERLNELGLLRQAGLWLEKNPPPEYWRGTAFEWAELEMMA